MDQASTFKNLRNIVRDSCREKNSDAGPKKSRTNKRLPSSKHNHKFCTSQAPSTQMCALVILLLALLQVVGGSASICHNATVSSTANFAFKVDLMYGQEVSCPGGEEVAIRDAVNDGMTNMSIAKPGGPTAVLNGDICVDNEGHRNLVLINSFTWAGRASK